MSKREAWEWARSIIIAVVLAVLIRLFLFEVFVVEGASMYPTLDNHERLVVSKLVYHLDNPQPGDIVVFNYSPHRDFIKRVIGISGDRIEIKGGEVFVNDLPLQEPYLLEEASTDFGPVVVPSGSVFLLGDNRNNSMDSRDPNVGYVPIDKVKGKALFVFWPFQELRLLGGGP
ncbi:MAG TPA: signal peptidase I, partial [Firmicutes bacterium]|nr:signal peptidase I [Bacillota bacterium]